MLLGGLWHGAAWTFVIWGAYHGLLLAAYRALGTWWDKVPLVGRRLGMFLFVVVGWVFFRATDFHMAVSLLRAMFSPVSGVLVPQAGLAFFALGVGAWWAMVGPNAFQLRHEYRWPGRFVLASGFAASLAIIIGLETRPSCTFSSRRQESNGHGACRNRALWADYADPGWSQLRATLGPFSAGCASASFSCLS
jgi:alginate O-acetyltransferase complex protein AlgI